MSALLVLLAVVALALIVAYWFPDATRRWVKNIMFARRIIFGAMALVVAFIFIGSGVLPLVLVGGFTFAIAVWLGYFQVYRGEEVL